jgi:hypothetical protein
MTNGTEPKFKSTDEGIDKYGYNADVDAAEDIWSGGGDFPWANIGTNGVTTIDSTSANDKTGSTGAITVEVEGLTQVTKGRPGGRVTGGQIVREEVTMDGTDAVTLTNQFSFVYRAKVLTAGSNNGAVGTITILIGANVIARIEANTAQTEMAVMIVPQFNSEGSYIHGAWLHNWGSTLVANTAANMGISIDTAAKATTVFAIQRRGVCTVNNDVDQELHAPLYYAPGTRFRLRANSVSAGNQQAAGYFTLEYDV